MACHSNDRFWPSGRSSTDKFPSATVLEHRATANDGTPVPDGAWNYSAGGSSVYGIYDSFLVNEQGKPQTTMSNTERAAEVTSDKLFWSGTHGTSANLNFRPKIHAPAIYETGSSVSHLDETVHGEELMSPQYSGRDITLSPLELGMLQDIGWTLFSSSATSGTEANSASMTDDGLLASVSAVADGSHALVANGNILPDTRMRPFASASDRHRLANDDHTRWTHRSVDFQLDIRHRERSLAVIDRPPTYMTDCVFADCVSSSVKSITINNLEDSQAEAFGHQESWVN